MSILKIYLKKNKILVPSNSGFTMIELLVSIGIFALVGTAALSLFNQVLRMQRRADVSRRATQAIRSSMEFISKEVRSGRIDYGILNGLIIKSQYPSQCPQPPQAAGSPSGGATYAWNDPNRNFGLAIVNSSGEAECIYYNSSDKALYVQKVGLAAVQRLTPPDVSVNRFEVRVVPGRDPYMTTGGGLAEIQPSAQILMDVTATIPGGESKQIVYQTAISSNDYDIPRE